MEIDHQANTWTNAVWLSSQPGRNNFSEIWTKTQKYSLKKIWD